MNVIVVVCNSLHLGFLGAYGNAWIETPSLDRLASEGIVFDHHFPENLTTLPTRRSWWTGRYGFADPDQGWTPLRPDERILPDLLWNQGVRTAFISDVPLLRETGMGYGRGFDEVHLGPGPGLRPACPPRRIPAPGTSGSRMNRVCGSLRRTIPISLSGNPDGSSTYATGPCSGPTSMRNTGVARTVKTAIDWLERRGGEKEPFLLWLDIFSPHGPWDPPQPYRDQYVMAEPDEFEAGEEGDLVEEVGEDEDQDIDIAGSRGPDRRTGRGGRRRAQ